MTDTLRSEQTATIGEVVAAPDRLSPGTQTISELYRNIAERAGHVRNQTNLVGDDAAEIQRDAFGAELDARTYDLARQNPPTVLLELLSELGFAWRDIARMVGVSVPALRRWRNGERPTGDNQRAIAQVLAFARIIQEEHLPLHEIASWMEVPITREAPVTPIDLYASGHLSVVHDLAAGHRTSDAALDEVAPGWRERYRTAWEVSTADDGQPYIRLNDGT